MRQLSRVSLMGALLSTTVLSSVWAEDQKVQDLDSVTVYATRSAKSTFDVPAMVNKVDPEAAGNALSSTMDDLLKNIPAVDVENGPRRNGQTVSIRGFDDESIITLKDGRRQNFESAHDGRNFIDPSLLKSVEVVKGAASSIYGGGAIGGVIAFETKDAADMLKPGETAGANLILGGRSGNAEVSSTATVYGRTESVDIIGSLTYRGSGDIRTGDGGELDTEDDVFSGLLKTTFTANDDHIIGFEYQGSRNDGKEPNNGAGTVSSSNVVMDKVVSDHQFSAKYEYDNPEDDLLNLKLHAYLNNTGVQETDLTGSNIGRVQTRDILTLGFTADNQSKFNFSDGHNHTFSYGFEIYRDKQDGTSTATGDGSRAGVPNARAVNFGFYLQDEIEFDTGMGDFLIIPAIRYDRYSSEDEDGNSQNEGAFSPKIAMTYKPTENFMLFGSVAQAFRAPNLTEIYAAGLHFPGIPFVFPDNNFVPNPDLEPEKVTTFELGAGVNFNGMATESDALEVKGSFFYSKGKDFITQEVNVGAGTTTFLNIDNAKLYGFEVSGSYDIAGFNATVGLSEVYAEDDDTGEDLSNNVPLTLTTDFSYKIESISSKIGFRSKFAADNDRVESSADETDGYHTHDIYYRWAPTEGDFQNLTLDFGVSNIFDEDYVKRFAALKEEGRSFNLRASYKW